MKITRFKSFLVIGILMIFVGFEGKAQFSATKGKTIKQLVEELVGKDNMVNFEVSNIRYNGVNVDNDQTIKWGTGTFGELGDEIEEGIVLSTMKLTNLNQSPDAVGDICASEGNNSNPNHNTIDADLTAISGNTNLFDGHIIEFDFIPKGRKIKFDYIFGSDEYPYYVCSKFNDAFGFFLSGPGINGSVNLAQLPGGNEAVSINNVNSGSDGTNFISPCAISPINDVIDCNLNNAAYFRDNLTNEYIPNMELNGYTIRLEAKYDDLKCREKYTIKLAIADVADHRYNSGVFLESGSFQIDIDTVADIVKLDVPICAPFEVTAQNGIPVPEEIWIWGDGSLPETVKPGGQEVKHSYDKPGTYIIKLIGIDDESCVGRDTVEREITIEPEAVMEVSSKIKLPEKCETFDKYEFEIELITKNVQSSVWKLDGKEIARDVDKIKETIEDEGDHEVTVELTSDPCGRDTTLTWPIKYVKPKAMEVSAGEPQEIGCFPFEFEFWSKTKYATEIHWDFGDGNESDEENPKHKYKKTGDYTVTFTAKNDTLCEREKTLSFEVKLLRDKAFDPDFGIFAPEPCESLDYDLKVEVFYTGDATDKVKWDFDDDHVIRLYGKDIYDTVEHIYTKGGIYNIRLKAYDELCGLDSVMTKEIIFKRKPNFEDIFAPNVFTPNGDRINDQFTMFYQDNKEYDFYSDVLEYEVDVFNRWGTKVFGTGMVYLKNGEERKHWDGSTPLIDGASKKEAAADGVFFYMIKYKMECLDEKKDAPYREIIGNVHLMR